MKRFLVLMLCLAMVISIFAACSSEGGGGEKVKSIQEVNEDSVIPDDLSFEGEDFTILCREDNAYGTFLYEILADESETELVNQAVYERNREVMDIFGLNDIVARAIPGDWNNAETFINTFRNSIDAGTQDFDLIMGYAAYMANAELSPYFYNFHEIPYVQETMNRDYYYQDCVDELTINGQLKYMIGDYSLTYWDYAHVMYFNKELAESYGLDNIYDLVKEGKWTIDKCIEMARGKFQDYNNDDWPGSEDIYGYISDIPNTTDALQAHFDVHPTSRDENGTIFFNYDVNKMTNILNKMIEFKKTDDTYMEYGSSDEVKDENIYNKIFKEGRALFYPTLLSEAKGFRSMNMDFGIIPYPKWDEYQSDYLTCAAITYSVACVPADAPDLEKTGAVFDTLSYISNQKVIPAYYDKALKYKLTRDEDSAEMLDIIRAGFTVNFGDFYREALDNGSIFREMIRWDNPNFASYHDSNIKGWNRKLENLLKCYE